MSGKPSEPTEREKSAVLDAIRSRVGPVTKAEIVAKTALCDRVIRDCVNHLVIDGQPIASNRSGGGYVYTKDTAALELEYARLQSHAKHILERAAAIRKNHLEAQPTLFGPA